MIWFIVFPLDWLIRVIVKTLWFLVKVITFPIWYPFRLLEISSRAFSRVFAGLYPYFVYVVVFIASLIWFPIRDTIKLLPNAIKWLLKSAWKLLYIRESMEIKQPKSKAYDQVYWKDNVK